MALQFFFSPSTEHFGEQIKMTIFETARKVLIYGGMLCCQIYCLSIELKKLKKKKKSPLFKIQDIFEKE